MSQSDGPRTPTRRAETGAVPGGASGASSGAGATDAAATDVVLIHGPTEDQKGLRVLRAREQGLEIGEVRPIKEGQPLTGEIVRLRPRPGMPRVCDVETQVSREELDQAQRAAVDQAQRANSDPARASRAALGHAGPPRVSSEAYRTNWEAIYSSANAPGPSELN